MEETGRPLDPQELLSQREWIRGLARRLVGDEHAAEDVAQDTLATALTRRPPVLRSLRGWLATVTRSRAIDHVRSENARSLREQRTPLRTVPSTADLVARADAQRAVAAAVMELDEPYRTTVLLRHFEDLMPAEIGARTGVPRETVKTRLRRAHVLLREKLDDEFGGDRERWRAALLPLLGPLAPPLPHGPDTVPSPARPGYPEAVASTAGALVMSVNSKVAVVAVAALLLFAGAAAVSTLSPDEIPGEPVTSDDVAVAAGEAPVEEAEIPSEPRTLTGRVRRRSDGAPVAAVSIVLPVRGGRDVRAVTGSDGSFTLDAPAGAMASLSVSARGFAPESVPLMQETDDVGTIWVAAGARIVVRVVDRAGDAVGGANVVALRWRSRGDRAHVDSYLMGATSWNDGVVEERRNASDAHGSVTFENARAGAWHVVVDGPDVGTDRSAYLEVRPGAAEVRATVVVTTRVSLSGRVLFADGAPAADALVGAELGAALAGPSRTRTDAEGRFRLDGLATGTVSLTVALDDAGPGTKLAQVRVPDVPSIDLILPPTGRLTGLVTDEEGLGLPGEMVRIEVSGAATTLTTAVTDDVGRYEFAAIPVGTIGRFRVFSEDRVQLWPRIERGELVEPGSGEPTRRMGVIVAGGTTTVDAVLTRGGVITGSVTGPGGALAGVQVWRWRKPTRNGQNWASTTTEDDGTFRFPPDLAGPVALQVRHPVFYQTGLPDDVSSALRKGDVADEFIVEIPESGEVAMDVHVVAGGPVSGRVEDESGAPVADALVAFVSMYSEPPSRAVRSDGDGQFRLSHVRPGKGRVLRARTEDGVGAVKLDVLPEGVPDDVLVVVKRGAEAADAGAERTITGRVLLATSGRPIIGATVYALSSQPLLVRGRRVKDRWRNDTIVAVTDDDGRFDCVVNGAGRQWLSAESGDAIEEVVELAADMETVTFRLRRSLILSGHVRDVDGSALAGATLIAVSGHRPEKGDFVVFSTPRAATIEGRPGEARTRADGSFAIHGVPEGPCKINVFRAEAVADHATAMQAKPTAFGPFDAGTEGLDLRMAEPQRASLRLRVVRPDGTPVTIGSVRYVPEGALHGGFVNLRSDDGRVSIPDAADPSYAVRVTAYSEPRTTRVFRGLAPGQTEHDLVLAPGPEISGRVVDLSGAPVEGITVVARNTGPYDSLGAYSAATDSGGAFTLAGLESAKYELKTSSSAGGGWRRLLERVFAEAGDSQVELRTTLEGRVSGIVVDASGMPVAGMHLYFYRPPSHSVSGTVPHTTTDESGRFVMTGLDPSFDWEVEPQFAPRDHERQRKARATVSVGDEVVRLVVPAED